MPHIFGKNNPELSEEMAVKIFGFFDAKGLSWCAEQVSKDWSRIANRSELKELKDLYKFRVVIDHKIFRQCPQFQKETPDSIQLKRLDGGWTNKTFILTQNAHPYVTRLPGENTSLLIDRRNEDVNARIASDCGINPNIVYSKSDSGEQVSEFILHPKAMSMDDFKDVHNIRRVMKPLKTIHTCKKLFANTIDIFARNQFMYDWLMQKEVKLSNLYHMIMDTMQKCRPYLTSLSITKVPCHNDLTPSNFIFSRDNSSKMYIIDWEYSGNNDPMWDLAYFSIESNLGEQQEKEMFVSYYNGEIPFLDRIRYELYKPLVECWISLWTAIQIVNGNHVAGLDTLKQYEQKRLQHCIDLFKSPAYIQAFTQLKQHMANDSHQNRPCLFR